MKRVVRLIAWSVIPKSNFTMTSSYRDATCILNKENTYGQGIEKAHAASVQCERRDDTANTDHPHAFHSPRPAPSKLFERHSHAKGQGFTK